MSTIRQSGKRPSRTVDIDGDAVDLIARERKRIHHSAGNHRPAYADDSMSAERVGAAAEAAFSMRYDLPAPDADRVDGDDGHDFAVRLDGDTYHVEIKGSKHDSPSLMLSDGYQKDADAYVLASVDWPESVDLLGWIDAADVSDRSRREESKFGGMMDVIDAADLDPMPTPWNVEHAGGDE